jgi:trk system potassium uptake protein
LRVAIYGCGQVGMKVAEALSQQKHEVTVIDRDADSFRRLEASDGSCRLVIGDAIDQDVLRRAEVESADVFLALTGEDNANLFAAQAARELFGVQKVIVRVADPLRAQAFTEMGITTVCATDLIAEALKEKLGLVAPARKPAGKGAK